MDINLLILGALILSIVIGFITNINIGILSIVFSFILSYSYGLTENDILSLWPMKLFFILLSITYFYGPEFNCEVRHSPISSSQCHFFKDNRW
ncbi:hypothetical protein, partial [Vibrio vulnificus]|uniref:hypothetical protein n=2 Tax=Vibrio vulnificus TaxID=672 RepID=UPI003D31DC51